MKEIGKIIGVHGVDGDVVIAHSIVNQNRIAELSNLLIEIWDGSFIPYFIEEVLGVSQNEMCIKFEEVDSREEGKKLLNKKVYVFEDDAVQTHGKDDWAYLIGYQIINDKNELIGIISDILTYGPQTLIELEYNKKPIQLPLHQDLVIDINITNKTLKLEIAEGLLDIWN